MLNLLGSERDMLKTPVPTVDVSVFRLISLSCCSTFFGPVSLGAYVCNLISL